MPPVLIDGFPVYGFDDVPSAARWILGTTNRPNIAIALNAEKIVNSRANPKEFEDLKKIALFYPDGAPIVWLLRRQNKTSKRIPGVDLWLELMRAAGKRKIYLLGASEEVNKATAHKLRADFGLENIHRRNGFFDNEDAIIQEIGRIQPDIITVAMGSPRQENFILRAQKVCPHAFFMGVGGTYDVFVGRIKRAPVWMQKIGMEWLYRTIKQPKRIPRDWLRLKFLFLYLTRQV